MPDTVNGMTDDSPGFWRAVADDDGPGSLLLVLLESWKVVGDNFGILAVDLIGGMFETVCRITMRGSSASARLSTRLYAGYWADDEAAASSLGAEPAATAAFHPSALHATGVLAGVLPLELRMRAPFHLPVECWWMTLSRSGAEPGAELYRRAQQVLQARWQSGPDAHLPAYRELATSWESATSGG
jgi:hypothetical protein